MNQRDDQFMAAALDALEETFFLFDPATGKAIRWNKAFNDISGYDDQEIARLPAPASYYSPDDLKQAERCMQTALQTGRASTRLDLICKDGHTVTFEYNIAVVNDDSVHRQYIIAIGRDVSQRLMTEQALRKSEQRFALAMDATRDGLWDWDVVTDEVYYSPGYTIMLGYEVYEMPAHIQSWSDLIHPQDKQVTLKANMDCIENRCDDFSVEFRMKAKNGQWVWILGRGKAVARDADGRATRLIGTHTDITDRKRVEHAMEKRMVALTRPFDDGQAVRFEDLFNLEDIQVLQDQFAQATGVASIITHVDGTPITTPSNFCRLCNDIIRQTEKGRCNCFKSDAEIGRHNPGGPIIQPCLSGGLWDAGAAITVGGRHIANWLIGQVRDETQTEEKMRRYAREIEADEQQVVDAFREVPAMSGEQFQQVSQALFTLANQLSASAYQNVQQTRFIIEREKAESERETLIRELEDKNQEMEHLIYTISHDMKSPLVTIGGYLGMIQRDLSDDIPRQSLEDFGNIKRATGRMRELLDDLLELSRVGRVLHDPEDVCLGDLAGQAVQLVAGHLTDDAIRFQIAPDLPTLYGDRSRLLELLQNLVENAIKYSGDQPTPVIEIGCRRDEAETVYFVKDNGMGIAPQYHEKVFQLFEQIDPQGVEGTGAGLAIVKRIVETFKGRVWVESDGHGCGSTFCFTLPNAVR